MKKLLLLLAFALSASSTVFAEEVEIDGLWYNLSETTAEVVKYKNNVQYFGNIVIPETVSYNETEYSVTSIGNMAFYDCRSLTSVTIPNSVTTIGQAAFNGCCGLTSILIPNSVTSIVGNVFSQCSGLTAIVVEEENTKYDSRNNCNAIIETSSNKLIAGCKNTSILNGVTHIGNNSFQGCDMTSIAIPNSVTSIGGAAFADCRSLTSITIPYSVTSIGNMAFLRCSGLTSIFIPTSVVSIGIGAFENCISLTAIVVEDGNTGYDSRNDCNAIIETSSNKLIAGCKNTTIPNSVMAIERFAFSGCSDLTSITIPCSVTSIDAYAFYGCSGLTSIIIPNSVTSIRNSAFYGCSGLTSIIIPNSVTTIEDEAFASCASLTDIYCYTESMPTTFSYAFKTNNTNYTPTPIGDITLHVPAALVETYQEAEPWSDFKEIVALSTMDVPDQKIGLDGTTTVEIGLNNYETNFVAFQMDLTLPEDVSIDKTGCELSSRITDENQELTIGKLESGDYRITSTSLSLTPISGNEGTLLTLKLTAAEDFEGGQATISNIRFSTSNSVKVVMSDETFDIDILKKYKLRYIVDGQEYSTEEVKETTPLTAADEPTKEGYTFGGWSEVPETMPDHDVVITGRFYLFGDVNTDEEVDVVDVVDIARFVVATPSANFREKLADLNKDLTVNIADAVVLVNHIAGDQDFAMAPSIGSYDYNQCKLQLLSNGTNTLSLCLSGDAEFTAFQFDMELPENSEITTIKINGQRMSGHQLLYNKVGDNCYRVAVLSLSNAVFKGREGELLNISIDGLATDEISIHDIHFVTKTAIDFTFEDISHCETVTSINHVQLDEGNSVIFDLQGRKLSKAQRGVNIIRSVGRRMQGKKVLVNR